MSDIAIGCELDDTRDIRSMYMEDSTDSKLFDLNRHINENDDVNSFITITSSKSNSFNLTLQEIEQTDVNDISNNSKLYPSNEANENLNKYLNMDESLCTECKSVSRLNNDFPRSSSNFSLSSLTEIDSLKEADELKSNRLSNMISRIIEALESSSQDAREIVTESTEPDTSGSYFQSLNLHVSNSISDNPFSESINEKISTKLSTELEILTENWLGCRHVNNEDKHSIRKQLSRKRPLIVVPDSKTEFLQTKRIRINVLKRFKSVDDFPRGDEVVSKSAQCSRRTISEYSIELPIHGNAEIRSVSKPVEFGNEHLKVDDRNKVTGILANVLELHKPIYKQLGERQTSTNSSTMEQRVSCAEVQDNERNSLLRAVADIPDLNKALKSHNSQESRADNHNFTNSQSAIAEIRYIDVTNDVDGLKNLQLVKKLDTYTSETCDSMSVQSTIEEVHYMDDKADCLKSVQAPQETARHETIPEGLTVDKTIENRKVVNDLIDQLTISSILVDIDEKILMNTHKSEHVDSSNNKNLENLSAVINERPTKKAQSFSDDSELLDQHVPRMNEKLINLQEEITAYKFDSENCNCEPGKNINSLSVKDLQATDENISSFPDDSFLEFSIESKLDEIEKQDVVIREHARPVHMADNITVSFTVSDYATKDNSETSSEPVNLTSVTKLNVNNYIAENPVPQKNIQIEKTRTIDAADDFGSQFPTNTQLETIDRQCEAMMGNINSADLFTDCAVNSTLRHDTKISNRDMKSSASNLSFEEISESQLQKIDIEASAKLKEAFSDNSENLKPKRIVNNEDVFYKPKKVNLITEDNGDDLILPDWVINPAPEPDYDKIRRTIQMRRQYIKTTLQEILRLSTIVSKLQSVLQTEHKDDDSEVAADATGHIQQTSSPNQHAEMTSNNQFVEPGTSSENNMNGVTNVSTKELRGNDIFYIPQSKTSKSNGLPNSFDSRNKHHSKVRAATDIATINTIDYNNIVPHFNGGDVFYVPPSSTSKFTNNFSNNFKNCSPKSGGAINSGTVEANDSYNVPFLKDSEKFYVPQSGRFKYDTPPIFNPQRDVKLKNNDPSHNRIATARHDGSNNFGSLKNNTNGYKNYKSTQENKNTFQKIPFETIGASTNMQRSKKEITTKHQPPITSSLNSAISDKRKTNLNLQNEKSEFWGTNKVQTVSNNNTNFYLPDKSVASNNTFVTNNCRPIPGIKNNSSFLAHLKTESSARTKPDKSKLLTLGGKLTPHGKSANGIFYKGN